MVKLKIKLVRSTIGQPKDQKSTVQALGLRKMNQEVEWEVNPQIAGMIRKVRHLLHIEEVK